MAITIDKHTSVEVENYNGIYSIKQGWVGHDGVFKATIVKRRFKKDGEEKNAPFLSGSETGIPPLPCCEKSPLKS